MPVGQQSTAQYKTTVCSFGHSVSHKAPLYTKLTQIYLDLPPLVWDMIAFT